MYNILLKSFYSIFNKNPNICIKICYLLFAFKIQIQQLVNTVKLGEILILLPLTMVHTFLMKMFVL